MSTKSTSTTLQIVFTEREIELLQQLSAKININNISLIIKEAAKQIVEEYETENGSISFEKI